MSRFETVFIHNKFIGFSMTHICFSFLFLCQVLVTVLDVNDFRPRFSERAFSTTVFENEPSGTSVITLLATDLDEGENALLTYSLQGPGAGRRTHTHGCKDPLRCFFFFNQYLT